MSLLPESFLKSIVSVELKSNSWTTTWTAFLYWTKLKKIENWKNHYAVFLITNRHLVRSDAPMTIRYNKIGWGSEEITLEGTSNWIFPDNKNIDLAILQLNAKFLKEKSVDYASFTEENSILTEEDFLLRLRVWQDIFLAWFPLGIKGIERNFPIARQGIIARNDTELIKNGNFYLDVNNFPGNSGGPIFSRPSPLSLDWMKALDKAMIIGVICAYQPFVKTLYDISQNPPVPMMITNENSGIAVGIPIYIAHNLAKECMEKQWEELF